MIIKEYYPNYKKVYPGEDISAEVMEVLRQTDRKSKYIEYDLKRGVTVFFNNKTGEITEPWDPFGILGDYGPSREIPLEMLLESGEKAVDYIIDGLGDPLNVVIARELITELYRYLAMLNKDERKLINGLFFFYMTQTAYAKFIGKKQPEVNEMKKRTLKKLKKIIGNNPIFRNSQCLSK